MADLSQFPIVSRWPAKRPDVIQLYSLPTPNGVKVSIALEELGLDYEPHRIDIGKNENADPAFVSLNPNGKIPAIIDPNGPGGRPLGLFELGAILVYLAEKTGRLFRPTPRAATGRWNGCSSRWLRSGRCSASSASSISSPAANRGQAPARTLRKESHRLIGVLETRLTGRAWIMGEDYTIADISLIGWVRDLVGFYGAADLIEWRTFKEVPRWLEAALARPAVQRGLTIPAAA